MQCYLSQQAPATPPDEYVSPAVRTRVVLIAPSSAPATSPPLPDIIRETPAITPAMVHTGATAEDWEQCTLTRWIAEHPILAGAGLVAAYLLLAGRKRRQ